MVQHISFALYKPSTDSLMLLVDPQLESDKERHERQERELKQSLEQQRQAAAQAQQDADSAAMRHHRELETLQKRFQVTRT